MLGNVLTTLLTPFKQPFADYPGVFAGLAVLCLVVGLGLGRLPGAYRRRVLEKRLKEAKGQVMRTEAEGRRFAELLGVTANARTPLMRLSNDQLREKTETFVASLRSQLAAWKKEIDGRLARVPPSQLAAEGEEARNRAWDDEARRLLSESSARLAAYHDRFKVDAVILRTEISRRLERPPERSMEAVTRVASPPNLSAMVEVASDLDALAQLLPDDRTARAQAAERSRRKRGRA